MKNKLIKNKKADVPIMILVIGVIAICILAILSFFNSDSSFKSNTGVEVIEEINADVEEFYFYVNAGFSEEEAAGKIGAEIIDNKLVIKREKREKKKKIILVQYDLSLIKGFHEDN